MVKNKTKKLLRKRNKKPLSKKTKKMYGGVGGEDYHFAVQIRDLLSYTNVTNADGTVEKLNLDIGRLNLLEGSNRVLLDAMKNVIQSLNSVTGGKGNEMIVIINQIVHNNDIKSRYGHQREFGRINESSPVAKELMRNILEQMRDKYNPNVLADLRAAGRVRSGREFIACNNASDFESIRMKLLDELGETIQRPAETAAKDEKTSSLEKRTSEQTKQITGLQGKISSLESTIEKLEINLAKSTADLRSSGVSVKDLSSNNRKLNEQLKKIKSEAAVANSKPAAVATTSEVEVELEKPRSSSPVNKEEEEAIRLEDKLKEQIMINEALLVNKETSTSFERQSEEKEEKSPEPIAEPRADPIADSKAEPRADPIAEPRADLIADSQTDLISDFKQKSIFEIARDNYLSMLLDKKIRKEANDMITEALPVNNDDKDIDELSHIIYIVSNNIFNYEAETGTKVDERKKLNKLVDSLWFRFKECRRDLSINRKSPPFIKQKIYDESNQLLVKINDNLRSAELVIDELIAARIKPPSLIKQYNQILENMKNDPFVSIDLYIINKIPRDFNYYHNYIWLLLSLISNNFEDSVTLVLLLEQKLTNYNKRVKKDQQLEDPPMYSCFTDAKNCIRKFTHKESVLTALISQIQPICDEEFKYDGSDSFIHETETVNVIINAINDSVNEIMTGISIMGSKYKNKTIFGELFFEKIISLKKFVVKLSKASLETKDFLEFSAKIKTLLALCEDVFYFARPISMSKPIKKPLAVVKDAGQEAPSQETILKELYVEKGKGEGPRRDAPGGPEEVTESLLEGSKKYGSIDELQGGKTRKKRKRFNRSKRKTKR